MFLVFVLISLISFLISYALFYPSVRLAHILGAIDLPSERKIHTHPTTRLGGLTFFVSFSVLLPLLPIDTELKISLLTSGIIIFAVGLLDDSINISPFAKLSGQFLASAFYIFFISVQEDNIISKIFGILTLLWIIFITNATNLSDGLDGLAGGMTSTQALSLAVISLIIENYDIFLCSVLLLFAILGFLPRNIPPAKTFMGDCGSLFLGFTLGALSTRLVYDSPNLITVLAILLIFRVPSADIIQSFVRRIINKKNPFSADRGHFHHRLIDFGFTKECAALVLITASLAFGFLAILLCKI